MTSDIFRNQAGQKKNVKNKSYLVRPDFWTNPLRDTCDPNLHRALQIAREELQGWTETDASHLRRVKDVLTSNHSDSNRA